MLISAIGKTCESNFLKKEDLFKSINSNKNTYLDIALSLCQDLENQVRETMCKQLPYIATILGLVIFQFVKFYILLKKIELFVLTLIIDILNI